MYYCKIDNSCFYCTDFNKIEKFSLEISNKRGDTFSFKYQTQVPLKEEDVIIRFRNLFNLFLNATKGRDWIRFIENDGTLKDIESLRLRKASISFAFINVNNDDFYGYNILVEL